MTAPPPGTSFIVQYARVVRLRNRLERRSAPNIQAAVIALIEYEDDVISFFTMCWHVKDWIVNDDTIPLPVRDRIRIAANASPPLQICHDIANGAKHYTLTQPKVGYVSARDVELVNEEDGRVGWKFLVVLPDGTSQVAHELAADALRAWA